MALAVYASFYIRPMIGYKAWRAFHYLAFAVFGLGTVHGLLSGSDSGAVWALGIYAVSVGAVALMLAYRIATRRTAPATIRRLAMDASGRARMEAASGGLRG
jgi:DMSO/TMAO reductase YedYZ heme-binding membrane subunit